MLNDAWRTQLMVRAVELSVRPGDVVLDIGTGTGILAMAAARAGASKVFALERGEMAGAARAVVAANGFSATIEVIQALSSSINLDPKADLVVGEILGNDPLGEGISRVYRDAALRLARPDARYLPSQLELWVYPIAIPAQLFDAWSFSPRNVEGWRQKYGFDFTALLKFVPPEGEYRLANAAVVAALQEVGPRVKLLTCRPQDLVGLLETTISAQVFANHRMNGLLLAWTAHLAVGMKLDVFPPLPESCHWYLPVWVLPQEIPGPAELRIDWTFLRSSSFRVTVL